MKKIYGILSEEKTKERMMLDDMSFDELDEYIRNYREELTESPNQSIPIDMSFEDFLKKYDLVDVTSFFASHGLKI